MPVWNSRDIVWLAMESYCRQKTRENWELIIYEERHAQSCGQKFFMNYWDRLKKAGCVNLRYKTNKMQQPLSIKWAELGRAADESSTMFCICDADNYYQKYMIQDAADAYRHGFDWVTTREGYFYNILSHHLVRFSLHERPAAKTGIQMAVATSLMRKLPMQEKHRLLNAWVFNNCRPRKRMTELSHINSVGTHGHNNISDGRGKMIDQHKMPFYKTKKKLEDILPEDIAKRLSAL